MSGIFINNESRGEETDANDTPKRTLQFEYETLMEEYRNMKERILRRLESDEKNYEFTLLTYGVVTGASSIIINNQIYVLLLVLAIPFYTLIWAQVRRSIESGHLATYIKIILIPAINRIVNQTTTTRDTTDDAPRIVYWEEYIGNAYERMDITGVMHRLPTIGKTFVQLFAIILLVSSYFYLQTSQYGYFFPYLDVILLIIHAIMMCISILAIVRTMLLIDVNRLRNAVRTHEKRK